MRKILIAIAVLLSGCQTTDNPNTGVNNSSAYHKQAQTNKKIQSKNAAIYNRYKKTGDRYTIQQDAAPSRQKKISFKEPVPTKEPLSRYGNPTEYKVDGKAYEVMRNSTGYKARGVASWYGTKFHKQRTSSGEPYDMYVMSAAHKTLPLPTYVKVRNLENGKEAVVKVNDRGPFHADRVIDLSYAAALKLGVFPQGTAHVEIETLMGPAGEAHYYLQAGAFSTEILARHLQKKLAHLTPSPVFVEHYKQHYVVRVGPFSNKAMSDSLKNKLAHNGVNGAFSVLI